METTVHVGRMLTKYIDKHLVKRVTLGRQMGIPNTAIYAFEKRASLQTGNLLRICNTLRHNFFMDIANSLPQDFGHDETITSPKDELIAAQAEEIKKLRWENELLQKLLKK